MKKIRRLYSHYKSIIKPLKYASNDKIYHLMQNVHLILLYNECLPMVGPGLVGLCLCVLDACF